MARRPAALRASGGRGHRARFNISVFGRGNEAKTKHLAAAPHPGHSGEVGVGFARTGLSGSGTRAGYKCGHQFPHQLVNGWIATVEDVYPEVSRTRTVGATKIARQTRPLPPARRLWDVSDLVALLEAVESTNAA